MKMGKNSPFGKFSLSFCLCVVLAIGHRSTQTQMHSSTHTHIHSRTSPDLSLHLKTLKCKWFRSRSKGPHWEYIWAQRKGWKEGGFSINSKKSLNWCLLEPKLYAFFWWLNGRIFPSGGIMIHPGRRRLYDNEFGPGSFINEYNWRVD